MSAFRAQLVLEEQRRLYDAWLALADGAPMPTREAFQPRGFAALLPWISIINCAPGEGPSVRLWGSQLKDVLGDEPRARLLCPRDPGGAPAVRAVRETARPLCGAVHQSSDRRAEAMRFWMRLPLGRGGDVEQVACLDIALARQRAPDWALARMAVAV